MQLISYLTKKAPFLAVIGLVFGLYSCGSYQYVGVDNDGIYGTTPRTVEYEQAVVETPQNSNNNYYQNYFKNKSLETEYMVSGSDIFTDVDAYESGNYDENISNDNTYQGYGGWGQTNSNVTINYIDNGLWNDPFFYGGWGWNRWNNIGWNRWNHWGWNGGFYDPFWGPQFYGGFGFNNSWGYGYYGNPYRNNFYGNNNFYNRPNVSYSASRRGSVTGRNTVGVNNTTYNTTRRGGNTATSGNISRYNTTRRSSINTTSPSSTYNSRQYNSNGTRVNTNTQRRTTTYSTPSANSTTRSTSPTVRRSSGSTYTPSNRSNSGTTNRSSNSTYTPSRSYTPSATPSSTRSSSGSSGSSRSSGSSSGGGRRG